MKKLTNTALEEVLNASGQGVMVVEAEGSDPAVVFLNEELAQATGISAARFLSSGLAMFELLFPAAGLGPEFERCRQRGMAAEHLVSGARDDGTPLRGALRVAAIITRGSRISHVAVYFHELHSDGEDDMRRELEDVATSDRLTGLCQRRYFDTILTREWGSAIREEYALAILLVEVDEFAKYNETFGRQAADSCLRLVGRAVKASTRRSSDLSGRFDSETFVTMGRGMDAEQCQQLGDMIRERVLALCIHHPRSSVDRYVSVSVGAISVIPKSGSYPLQAIEKARAALDQASKQGGNQVVSGDFR